MNTQPEGQAKPNYSRGCLIIVVLLIALFGVIRLVQPRDSDRRTAIATRSAVIDQSEEFTIVRNDCGLCGTNSPVGGWETEDGRALILDANGSFTAIYDDGTSTSGSWEQSGDSLCLLPSVGGEKCFRYGQLVDAMKLDNAVYIRQ